MFSHLYTSNNDIKIFAFFLLLKGSTEIGGGLALTVPNEKFELSRNVLAANHLVLIPGREAVAQLGAQCLITGMPLVLFASHTPRGQRIKDLCSGLQKDGNEGQKSYHRKAESQV